MLVRRERALSGKNYIRCFGVVIINLRSLGSRDFCVGPAVPRDVCVSVKCVWGVAGFGV